MVSRSQRIDVDSSKTEVRSNALDKFGRPVILRFDLVMRLDKKMFNNFDVEPVAGIGRELRLCNIEEQQGKV